MKRPGFLRALTISFYIGLLCAVAAAAFAVSLLMLNGSGDVADRLGELADVFTASALVIAIIAALVALQTYAVSTALPHLRLQVSCYLSRPNYPVFRSITELNECIKTGSPVRQTDLIVSIKNTRQYAARNVMLTITLASIGCDVDEKYPRGDRWAVASTTDEDGRFVGLLQWSESFLIHGRSMRVLPPLHLGTLTYLPTWGHPLFCFEILADGYRREVEIPVFFSLEDANFTSVDREEAPEWV